MKHKQYLYLKKGVKVRDLLYMHPALLTILAFVNSFCNENKIHCEVTSIHRTAEEDARLGARTKTHQEFRAFDLSLINFSNRRIRELKMEIEREFEGVGAISSRTYSSRPIVVHNVGHGYHAHFQVRKNL